MSNTQINPYRVLGVEPKADAEAVKAAYRRLAKEHHPDKGGDAARFAEATLAYDVLMDPARRKLFDETGRINDLPVGQIEDMARGLIFDMLAHALMGDVDPLAINLLNQIEVHFGKQIGEFQQKNQALERAAKRATRMAKRFIRKKTAEADPNLFIDMLARHQQQIAEAVEANARQVAIRHKALEIVRDYSFKMDAVQQSYQSPYSGFGTSGATSGSGWR